MPKKTTKKRKVPREKPEAGSTKPAKTKTRKRTSKKRVPRVPKEPKIPKAPRVPKELRDSDKVLERIPSQKEIEALELEELDSLFARILESERGLSREKGGFLHRYYEHCEALRFINAAKRHLKGEPPREDTPYWATHPSRTWRNQTPSCGN